MARDVLGTHNGRDWHSNGLGDLGPKLGCQALLAGGGGGSSSSILLLLSLVVFPSSLWISCQNSKIIFLLPEIQNDK